MNNLENSVLKSYELAKEQYAMIGVDTDAVVEKMKQVEISLHCWQTDDVAGLESADSALSGGGIQSTGNYKGRARNIEEIRADLQKVVTLIPGKLRLNLHAIYGDFGGEVVDRDQIELKHYQSWIDWCSAQKMGMDFNATCFSHSKSDSGYTLSSKDKSTRDFWIEHVKRCRAISAEIGKQLGSPCVHNLWIPDGSKDVPVDRNGFRTLLKSSLDEALSEQYSQDQMLDAVESKLFGIGAESMTVGSHDFYYGYALSRGTMLCLDNGHFHPTEEIADKISSCMQFFDKILLHVTRPVRWDSDHVVTLNDDIKQIASEIVRNDFMDRVKVGLDFFDGSINRLGAYVVGTRAAQKAFMIAMLEPTAELVEMEAQGAYFQRLAMLEELKSKPFGAVWDYYCLKNNVPVGEAYIKDIEAYERDVLSKR